jgi:hypothetical protein
VLLSSAEDPEVFVLILIRIRISKAPRPGSEFPKLLDPDPDDLDLNKFCNNFFREIFWLKKLYTAGAFSKKLNNMDFYNIYRIYLPKKVKNRSFVKTRIRPNPDPQHCCPAKTVIRR